MKKILLVFGTRPEAIKMAPVCEALNATPGLDVRIGTDTALILGEATTLLDDAAAYQAMARAHNPYGDGLASQRIRDAILDFFGLDKVHV